MHRPRNKRDTNAAALPTETGIVPAVKHGNSRSLVMMFAALGVVFGDIGTSPLYSLQTVFSTHGGIIKPVEADIYGVISMVFWSITLIVTVKYVTFVMRADNEGEGGILALVHLLRDRLKDPRMTPIVIMLGIIGASLFYGDSVITPAISVMSSIEGLSVANPAFETLVLPLSVTILTMLFLIQRWGTGTIGRAFAPIMCLWFLTLAVLGIPHVVAHPEIIRALSPHYAAQFLIARPKIGFVAFGAVVLTITGAEALYADMGHFGRTAIRKAWFFCVWPALTINYLGQGAMLLADPSTAANPFFHLAPSWATIPLVVLATMATVIASQAVISGAFSVSRQAVRLGLLPRLKIRHTSKEEGGQIYIPTVNWLLFVVILMLIAIFQSSARLANAYGLAVTGTEVLSSILFLTLAKKVWKAPTWKLVAYVLVIGLIEFTYFAANVVKIPSGGWLPLLIAAILITIMTTWLKGHELLAARRAKIEGPLDEFIEQVRDDGALRVPGLAVFPHPNSVTTPLALRSNLAFNHVLHEHVVIISIINENVPHVRHVDRIQVSDLGDPDDGIAYVSCRVGFNDSQDIPKALALAIGTSPELEDLREEKALYFLSVSQPEEDPNKKFTWRKRLFTWLSNNAADGARSLRLPIARTAVMGAKIKI